MYDEGCHPKIILSDGAKLTVTGGISINSDSNNGCSLNIYGQLNNTGQLYAHTSSEYSLPGIGGGYFCSEGTLHVYGGQITATGGYEAAGIGCGQRDYANPGTIIIEGGKVTAYGDNYAGGTVVAKAGKNETGCRAIGPGKGSGDYGQLTLGNNMMVTSERKFSASERKGGCWYRTNVRVEPCTHEDCTYTIDGTGPTNHHTKHCPYCATTFEQELHDYASSSTCKVCGAEASAFLVKIYLPKDQGGGIYDGHTYDGSATYQMVPNTKVNLPACPTIVPGMVFIGWEETTISVNPYSSPYTDYINDLLQEGDEYTITKNVSFVARYNALDLTLQDNADNAEILSLYDGEEVHSVTLTGRA